jgi:hypothetical protein
MALYFAISFRKKVSFISLCSSWLENSFVLDTDFVALFLPKLTVRATLSLSNPLRI